MRTLLLLSLATLLAAAEPAAAPASPAGPTATVDAFRQALANGDAAAAQALLVRSDADSAARIARLAAALKAWEWDFRSEAERIDGDCAVVLVRGSRDRAGQPDLFPLYLVGTDAGWRLLPDPTRPRLGGDARSGRLAALGAAATTTAPAPAVAPAGEGLGTWAFGPATVAGHPLRPGQPVHRGRLVSVAANRPARLVLNPPAQGSIAFAPGSQASLTVEPVEGGEDLVIDLQDGIVQVAIDDRGRYAHVRVRGLTSDVLVTGTIFLVQRAAKGGDYVAQVEGTVTVRQRQADGKPGANGIRLVGHQGVAVGPGGFAPVDQLKNRPQLTPELLASGGLREQGMADSGLAWEVDRVAQERGYGLGGDQVDVSMTQVGGTTFMVSWVPRPNAALANTFGVLSPGLGSDQGQAQGLDYLLLVPVVTVVSPSPGTSYNQAVINAAVAAAFASRPTTPTTPSLPQLLAPAQFFPQ